MASIKRTIPATTENALEGIKFSVLNSPALLSLYAVTTDEGDTISLSVGDRDILVEAEPNVEVASGVVDTDRDGILIQEPVPAGKLYLRATVTTDIHYLLVIEPTR